MGKGKRGLTDRPDKDLERPTLDVRRAPKVNQLDIPLPIQNHILILDVPVHHQRLGMQVMHRPHHLQKDAPALRLVHARPQLDIIKQIHPRQAMRHHLDVIVRVVLEERLHLHDIRVPQLRAPQII